MERKATNERGWEGIQKDHNVLVTRPDADLGWVWEDQGFVTLVQGTLVHATRRTVGVRHVLLVG